MLDWVLSIRGVLIMLGLNIQGFWVCQGYTGFCVSYILKIRGILNELSSEYAKVLNVSGVYICYNYKGSE